MSAKDAKKAGRKVRHLETIFYLNHEITFGSAEHHQLMKTALEAKFADPRNTEAKRLLLYTYPHPITHELKYPDGTLMKDSTSLPRDVFTSFLTEIRQKYIDEQKPHS